MLLVEECNRERFIQEQMQFFPCKIKNFIFLLESDDSISLPTSSWKFYKGSLNCSFRKGIEYLYFPSLILLVIKG